MRRLTVLPLLFTTLCLSLAPVAMAEGDDDRRGRGRGHDRWEHKEEFWAGNCKIERKWERNGDYKEERKCKGERHGWHDDHEPPRRRVRAEPPPPVYPPWIVVQQGAPVYAPQHRPAPPQRGVFQCESEAVGQVLGGIVGGVLGNQIGGGSGRALATVGGAVAGVLVGGEVGRRLDAADHACVGRVLEFAPTGQRVQWHGSGMHYAVVPGAPSRRSRGYCRPYVLERETATGWVRSSGTACRRGDGVWVARL